MTVTVLTKSEVTEYYKQMLLIRRFEEASGQLYMQGKIKGFLHLYIGEEAIAVGSITALKDTDYVITHYRDHGHALARGMDPNVVLAELYGKATGSSGGKGGSMHLFDSSRNFMGGYGIVGGHLPIAVGLAFAVRYRRENSVVLCFFGEEAVNEGEFHESMNLAALWKLPVLFVLENNLYGMGAHIDHTHAGGRDIYLTAESYKIPAGQIDGMDLVSVRQATINALEKIRSGGGPVFLEAMTYRLRDHSVADPSFYRGVDEISELKEKDPLEVLKRFCLEEELITEEEFDEMEDETRIKIDEARRFAEDSAEPDKESLYANVYA